MVPEPRPSMVRKQELLAIQENCDKEQRAMSKDSAGLSKLMPTGWRQRTSSKDSSESCENFPDMAMSMSQTQDQPKLMRRGSTKEKLGQMAFKGGEALRAAAHGVVELEHAAEAKLKAGFDHVLHSVDGIHGHGHGNLPTSGSSQNLSPSTGPPQFSTGGKRVSERLSAGSSKSNPTMDDPCPWP